MAKFPACIFTQPSRACKNAESAKRPTVGNQFLNGQAAVAGNLPEQRWSDVAALVQRHCRAPAIGVTVLDV